MEETIKNYLNNSVRGFIGEVTRVYLLTDGNGSNHYNYKVTGRSGDFVFRLSKSENMIKQDSLSDEYTILSIIESYNIAPKVFELNTKWQHGSYIIEEYLEGKPLSNFQKVSEMVFENIINLIVKTSEIKINHKEFLFKFSYSSYNNHFKIWDYALNELCKIYPNNSNELEEIEYIIKTIKNILEEKENLLNKAPKEFIYNDIHPGNIFLNDKNEVKFIDWQKVSLGDPAFMIALFIRRFGYLWSKEVQEFKSNTIKEYQKFKSIDNFGELVDMRIIERAFSDMFWIIKENIKKGEKSIGLKDNKYYKEVKDILLLN